MNKNLTLLIEEIALEEALISLERKSELDEISQLISEHLIEEKHLDIVVVCTHNSRRSQLGEVWINTLAHRFGIKNITAYSGGMEETAFNIRMIKALRYLGFDIDEIEAGANPKYVLNGVNMDDHLMFSKVYNHEVNPKIGYMAFMVCGDADENCPIIKGMKYRIPLRYKDPKAYDDTTYEREAYVDKVKEIGREMHYLLHQIKQFS